MPFLNITWKRHIHRQNIVKYHVFSFSLLKLRTYVSIIFIIIVNEENLRNSYPLLKKQNKQPIDCTSLSMKKKRIDITTIFTLVSEAKKQRSQRKWWKATRLLRSKLLPFRLVLSILESSHSSDSKYIQNHSKEYRHCGVWMTPSTLGRFFSNSVCVCVRVCLCVSVYFVVCSINQARIRKRQWVKRYFLSQY